MIYIERERKRESGRERDRERQRERDREREKAGEELICGGLFFLHNQHVDMI